MERQIVEDLLQSILNMDGQQPSSLLDEQCGHRIGVTGSVSALRPCLRKESAKPTQYTCKASGRFGDRLTRWVPWSQVGG